MVEEIGSEQARSRRNDIRDRLQRSSMLRLTSDNALLKGQCTDSFVGHQKLLRNTSWSSSISFSSETRVRTGLSAVRGICCRPYGPPVIHPHQRSVLNSSPIETSQRTWILRFHKPELSNCEYKKTLLQEAQERHGNPAGSMLWLAHIRHSVLVPVGLHRQPILIRTRRVGTLLDMVRSTDLD